MAISRNPRNVTDRNAVIRAIKISDEMGREAFRRHYGFGPARSYFVRFDGKTYDSKPIVAVAFGIQHKEGPLRYDDFSGGAATVKPSLEKMGFVVTSQNADDDAPLFSSEWLDVGDIYTRVTLREMFGIRDATINNGVFRPKGSSSIWLFVTKEKTADRPQLVDNLDGDVLHWEGQPAGRSDAMIIGHLNDGVELLLFYRDHRNSYPEGGFRYEGPFFYRSSSSSQPTKFVFDRDKVSSLSGGTVGAQDTANAFDPANVADGRGKVLAEVRRRRGQPKFRADLIAAYGGKCAVTDCSFLPLLEAAHIYPYRGSETNHVTNGILLRTDIHTLFDLGLVTFQPDGTVDVCQSLRGTEYAKLGRARWPSDAARRPNEASLKWHRENVASPNARAALVAKLDMQKESRTPRASRN